MTAIKPVQQPITGHETMTDPADPLAALSQFYRAFNGRDLALMEANWDNSAEAVMDNPLGGIKRGWREIRPVYERIFSGRGRVEVEFYDYTLQQHGEVFTAMGRERGRHTSEKETFELAIRTTRIFRKVDGGWRQIHHHGSIEDPCLLARYQLAVR
ncbi:MAG TPA: nuclear transport factor 2 family protein [Xanthobacteraceae bacterium]|nr:nuclear transport factor 2 family protein [Xanthobacteraceae bacterium]